MAPTLSLSRDVRGFLDQVRRFLERDEAENGRLLGMLDHLANLPLVEPPLLARVCDGEETLGVALLTTRNLIVSRGVSKATATLVSTLRKGGHTIPGLGGPLEEVVTIGQAWQEASGCEPDTIIEQMLYELRSIEWPDGIPGRMRPMGVADIDLVAAWLVGFHHDALPHEPYSEAEARGYAEARPAEGMTYLWEVEGEPVAMAALARPTRRGITINAVYTPPRHRGNGYASALVAALSAEGLGRGKEFCILYTDLANPTSNAIYQRIGYRPVSRSQHVRFRYPS